MNPCSKVMLFCSQLLKKLTMASALFGNSTQRQGGKKNLLEFKAGKMYIQGKMCYPDKRKGTVFVHQSDDSLMHFCWKDRTTGKVEDVGICIIVLMLYLT